MSGSERWAFSISETGRVLGRNWLGSRRGADYRAQKLANEHGVAVEYIEESRLVGWTGAHHQKIPEGYIVDPDDMTPAGLEEPGES